MDRTKAARLAKELVAKMDIVEKASQLRYDAPAIPRLGIPAYNWWNEAREPLPVSPKPSGLRRCLTTRCWKNWGM